MGRDPYSLDPRVSDHVPSTLRPSEEPVQSERASNLQRGRIHQRRTFSQISYPSKAKYA